MNIVQITPGAGGMYCGNCFRDNALVGALRRLGHATLMVPLYLPLRLDEDDQSAGAPIFFGGVNVYLDQKFPLYRRAPGWLRRWLDSRRLLRWAAGRAAKTRADEVGELMLSMLRGEEGHQARDLEELLAWLGTQPQRPDVICLSNALLAGLARPLRRRLGAPVVCLLKGEDAYLDSLAPSFRDRAWEILRERVADVDLFIAPSRYYAGVMCARLGVSPDKMRVVFNGIPVEEFAPAPSRDPQAGQAAGSNDSSASANGHSQVTPGFPRSGRPVLGYFARMCREKGLDRLVETFLELKRRGRVPGLRLRVGGGCGPGDEPFVRQVRERLAAHGYGADAEFHRNLDRRSKVEFYRSLTVFSVPALYGEAFGLYVIEAMAAGVPVVQPRHAAFPELVEETGAGLVCDPTPTALAQTIESLLLDPARARALGEAGRQAAAQHFSVSRMTAGVLAAYEEARRRWMATAG